MPKVSFSMASGSRAAGCCSWVQFPQSRYVSQTCQRDRGGASRVSDRPYPWVLAAAQRGDQHAPRSYMHQSKGPHGRLRGCCHERKAQRGDEGDGRDAGPDGDRKSTRLNSSHQIISYAVFCLKKKTTSKEPKT